ncbi:MAG: response regulator [Acidobacteriia bacterium]|nr:response regulator [Terriglobia bacterium]
MGEALRVLQIEDSESDAALIVRLLVKAQYEVHAGRVEDAEGLRAALAREVWDVIIADYHLPHFDAPAALRILRETGQDIPFLVVSGNLGEDLAVAMMKAGAHDYLMKGNLARLAPAVGREIREAGERRKRRRAEEAQRIGEERLAAIIGSAMDAIITVDETQRVVLFNAAAEKIFRCAAAEAIGQPLDAFIPERLVEIHRQHVQTFGTTGETARSMHSPGTLYGRRVNGEEFPLEATISHASPGGRKLYTVILRDITRRKQGEETARLYAQARELDRLKTEFFANISHELRTPLTLILGPVRKRIAAEGMSGEESRDLKLIEHNARLLLRHVNDLLDMSKIDAGRMEADYARVDLARMVRLVASNFESLAKERQVACVLDTPGSLPAEVDPAKIERVLSNLLSNAFKFTPAGGQVRIAVRGVGERALIEVEDTGPGIPPNLREAIFERFRQLVSRADRQYGGTGLGLAIAKQFVTLHGGTISVEEPPSHSGSLFRVELPLAAPGGTHVRRTAEEPDLEATRQAAEELRVRETGGAPSGPAPASGAPLVLLVEDNPDMSAFIAETLSATCRVSRAFDGQDGLEKALELHPDLILCDIMMPRMSGDRLVREIRSRRELEEVPIVLLTARADEELQVRLLREGAQDYLQKPFDARTILAKVDRFIADRRKRQEAEEALHRLSASLLQGHDEERKQIAQELHENVVQCLAALEINLSMAREAMAPSPEVQRIFAEGHKLLERCSDDIRAMSYGLHPPLLDHFGLREAMAWHVQGFVKRAGIKVSLDVPHDLGRLPAEFELTLFRVMQESLMNLHCHSGSKEARVRAFRDAREVGVEVSAKSGTFPGEEQAAEMEIAGMRERVRRLGGHLEMAGTTVRAVLPLPHPAG